MQVTNSLDIKTLRYEEIRTHKRKIAGKPIHLISRTAYRRLTANRLVRWCHNWSHIIFRNITRVGRKALGKSK